MHLNSIKIQFSNFRFQALDLIVLLFILPVIEARSAVGTAIANGNWSSASVWSFNRVPACSDTVTIPTGITVTVGNQNDYSSCTNLLKIIVNGTFQFTNGNKIKLPCNSTVGVSSGGLIKKSGSGGGNSTFIEICGNIEWRAGDGNLCGPVTLGGNSLPGSLVSFKAEPTN